jgi:6-phosphogluconolactonase
LRGPEVTIVKGKEPPAEVAAKIVYEAIGAVLKGGGACSVALAGGNTPKTVYEGLVHLDAKTRRRALSSVEFYFGDERCVAPEDKDSNYQMARGALGADRSLHRIEAERPDRDAAAKDYERVLPKELSIVILGIGEDGHTASLFPGSPALDERTRRVVAVSGAPKPPPERITITPPVIESARTVVMLAWGASKSDAVQRALEGAWNPKETPAQFARRGTWILDEAAASKLSQQGK